MGDGRRIYTRIGEDESELGPCFESGGDGRKGDVEEEGVVGVDVVAEGIVGDGISGEKWTSVHVRISANCEREDECERAAVVDGFGR